MRELHVRLEPLAEPRCGFDHATAAHYARVTAGETAITRIMNGLVFPKVCDMALVTNLDPLEAALEVYRALQFCPTGLLLRYTMALERLNAQIVERDRQLWEKDRARTAEGRARPGTRSTRAHGKRKAGRR